MTPRPLRAIGRWLMIVLAAVLGLLVLGILGLNVAVESTEEAGLDAAPGTLVQLDDGLVHYQRVGDPTGEPLVLVHGFGVAGGAEFAGLVAELDEGSDIYVVDQIGFGFSERPTGPGEALTHRGRADLLAEWATELDLEEATWVGASYGGAVIAELAVRHPEAVTALVMLDAQALELGGGAFQTIGGLPFGIGRASAFFALTGGPLSRSFYSPACPATCPIAGDVDYFEAVTSIEGTSSGFVAMSRTDLDSGLPESLASIEVPTLVVWGELDPLIPLASGRQIAASIPDAQLAVVEGAGHLPHVDEPSEVANLIDAFTGR